MIFPEMTLGFGAMIFVAVVSYALGSIPFGVVIARIFGLGNLRDIGSGNIGATNVLRTGNKLAAFLTLVLDAGKGAFAVLIAKATLDGTAAQIAGLFAFLGHCFPIWLRFQGGKGVATFLGTVLALAFPVGIAACLTWLATAAMFRFSSLAALVSATSVPFWLALFDHSQMISCAILLAVLIVIRHHENIARLMSGTESKIGKKSA